MSCPDEIAEILLEILRTGILRIRAMSWEENHARCAIEADHLHNLPQLVAHFSHDLLKYYWEVERVSFIEQISQDDLAIFSPMWDRLAPYLQPALIR
jgi:hypothetical protein